MNIVLIGMRGSGKTTVGKLLAERLGKRFVEMDELIAQKLGMSIPEIVSRYGWQRFRKVEAEVCREVARFDNTVNATGGGVVIKTENVLELQKSGRLIWLKASLDAILERIGEDSSRPSLTGKPLREDMETVLAERAPIYQLAADFAVETDGKTPDAVAGEILEYWREQGLD